MNILDRKLIIEFGTTLVLKNTFQSSLLIRVNEKKIKPNQ